MKEFQVKLSALAERDLIGIWHSIADHDPVAATKYIRLLDARISTLRNLPDRGVARPEFGKSIRILVEGNYLIFYRIAGDKVEVLRVVHGAMDLTRLGLA